jgi:hypothetical protein
MRRVNRKENVGIDSPASSGKKEKYTKHVSLPLALVDAALSILNVSFLLKSNFLRGN